MTTALPAPDFTPSGPRSPGRTCRCLLRQGAETRDRPRSPEWTSDTAQAQTLLDTAGRRDGVRPPASPSQPTTAKLEANLFKDAGQGSTTAPAPPTAGTNIDLAAGGSTAPSLLPGETTTHGGPTGQRLARPPAPTRTARAWTPPPAVFPASSRPTSTGLPSSANLDRGAPQVPVQRRLYARHRHRRHRVERPVDFRFQNTDYPSRLSPIWTKTTSSM